MPRLDNTRLNAWRDLAAVVSEVTRGVDEDLMAEWDIPLGWYEVLAALQRCGGKARPHVVAHMLRLPASSVSRRLDRLQDEGWVARHRGVDPDDGRAVELELTGRGRTLWRAMHVSYRRSVQKRFAVLMEDGDIAAVRRIIDSLNQAGGGGGGGGGYPASGAELGTEPDNASGPGGGP
jgi:DNA-binding MarR family transcriptional regulator